MERNEVLERLCSLTSEVMRRKFGAAVPADCFCAKGVENRNILQTLNIDFQFSESVLSFIETTVREKLNSEVR